MDVKFKIIKSPEICAITLKDYTNYLPDDSPTFEYQNFKKGEVARIGVLVMNEKQKTSIVKYTIAQPDEILHIPINTDAWYTVYCITIPTIDWYNSATQEEKDLYRTIYFTSGNGLQKYSQGIVTPATVDELLYRNTSYTTINKSSHDHVSICNLKSCFLSAYNLLLDKTCCFDPCSTKSSADAMLVLKRDTTWMAYNVALFAVERNDFVTARNIIDKIMNCGNMCDNSAQTGGDCGCR